jgi:hypothetical protein
MQPLLPYSLGEAPGYRSPSDAVQYSQGFIPDMSAPLVMPNPPSPAIGDLSHCSRATILRSALSLCQQPQATLEHKVDNMTNLVGHLIQLLLLEPNSGNGSPLANSWTTTTTTSSLSLTAAVAAGSGGSGPAPAAKSTGAAKYFGSGPAPAAKSTGAAKYFLCPVCPRRKHMTEKGFHKHVSAWRIKSKVSGKRKKASCPGIGSHPQFASLGGTVNDVVNTTLQLLTPGANLAHGHGTGNHVKVDEYFALLKQ